MGLCLWIMDRMGTAIMVMAKTLAAIKAKVKCMEAAKVHRSQSQTWAMRALRKISHLMIMTYLFC